MGKVTGLLSMFNEWQDRREVECAQFEHLLAQRQQHGNWDEVDGLEHAAHYEQTTGLMSDLFAQVEALSPEEQAEYRRRSDEAYAQRRAKK